MTEPNVAGPASVAATPRMDMGALLPCPCCSGRAYFCRVNEEADRNFAAEYIECASCGLTTNLVFPLKGDVQRELIERWNRRSELAALKAQVKAAAQENSPASERTIESADQRGDTRPVPARITGATEGQGSEGTPVAAAPEPPAVFAEREALGQGEIVAWGMVDTMLGCGNRLMMVRLDEGQDGCSVPLVPQSALTAMRLEVENLRHQHSMDSTRFGEMQEAGTKLEAEVERLRQELDRINRVAATGTAENWLALSDEDKLKWFAQTISLDSGKSRMLSHAIGRAESAEQQLELRNAEDSSAGEAIAVLFKALNWKSGGLGAAAIEAVQQLEQARRDRDNAQRESRFANDCAQTVMNDFDRLTADRDALARKLVAYEAIINDDGSLVTHEECLDTLQDMAAAFKNSIAMNEQFESLARKLGEAQKNDERYRWLRDVAGSGDRDDIMLFLSTAEERDAAIDAALEDGKADAK